MSTKYNDIPNINVNHNMSKAKGAKKIVSKDHATISTVII